MNAVLKATVVMLLPGEVRAFRVAMGRIREVLRLASAVSTPWTFLHGSRFPGHLGQAEKGV
jgi:hypothetical protein